MSKFVAFALAALVVTGCVSKTDYEAQLAQTAAISAEKDSLLNEVVATSQFISEVNGELAKARDGQPVNVAGGELETVSPAEARQRLLDRVKALNERLSESESRLEASRKRVAQLSGNNAALSKQLTAYDSTIASFRALIDNQKAEIVTLTEQIAALSAEVTALKGANTQLVAERTTLTEEKSVLTTEKNTVYWISGSKDALEKQKIIEQKGGMLGIGKTQVLARTLDASAFTAIDRTVVTEITLPNPTKSYRIISTNDLSGLSEVPKDGKFKGVLRIANPETFWRPSRFLVLVEQ